MSQMIEPKHIVEARGKPKPGCFAVEREPIDWIECRERFAPLFNPKQKGFFFSHEEGKSEDISAFITRTEDILEIPHSILLQTNRNYATWITLSEFWLECLMRRSLLTILLRNGAVYDRKINNYEEALYSHKYAADTKFAIMRFLVGFTNFVPPYQDYKGGWWSSFNSRDMNTIRNVLTLPKGKSRPFQLFNIPLTS